jgi:inner membrane protein
MDTIAHGLTGAVIGYCGFRQHPQGGREALWTAIAAAEFPDIDIVLASFGGETYLQWHRGPTHSILLLPVLAAFVAGSIWSLTRGRSFRVLWLAAVAGMASHLFLDWITNYGTELLWPVTDARLALSWVFIVDVYVWAALAAGLAAAIWTQRAAVASASLGVVLAFFVFCGVSRAVVLRGQPPGSAAFAVPLNPLRWTIVRTEGDRVHWIDGTRNDTFAQFRDETLLPKAEALPVVKLYRWFAAFPLVEKVTEGGYTVLRYRDLRFRTPMPWGKVREGMFVVAKVVFDANGNVVMAGLSGEDD